ncbi:hypothetical protein H4S06_000585 [Coemansia sp. BCRC 34490]|nr:hypothetical protein H4S06_000585 [Coemansia sp. BCRC 34490]
MVLDNDPQQLNPQTATTAYKQPNEHQVLVVIDTNFFIDHLPLISKLADLAGINGVLIAVPWVVIQELDGLKMSSKSSGSQGWLDSSDSVGAVARSSSRFLESVLEQNNSPFVFQKRSEYLQYEEVNDDKILDCCLYFCKEFGLPVVVLTKDRNLSIKARVNGCAVCSEASTRAEDFVLNIKTAALKAHSYQTQESKRSAPDSHINDDEMPESDSMDVDFVDDTRHASTHSNPTSNVPRSAVAGTSSVAATTYISGTAVSLGGITTGFDPPPWHTSTVLFTVILYYWDVLKQVLPRGIETNIRQSLPWIMYVEELQSCPQLKRPLPPNLRIAPFARTSHSSQTSEDSDLVSETKLLIQLAKRLLAQCALVENDVQERQRQKLVSGWVTWQNSKD